MHQEASARYETFSLSELTHASDDVGFVFVEFVGFQHAAVLNFDCVSYFSCIRAI